MWTVPLPLLPVPLPLPVRPVPVPLPVPLPVPPLCQLYVLRGRRQLCHRLLNVTCLTSHWDLSLSHQPASSHHHHHHHPWPSSLIRCTTWLCWQLLFSASRSVSSLHVSQHPAVVFPPLLNTTPPRPAPVRRGPRVQSLSSSSLPCSSSSRRPWSGHSLDSRSRLPARCCHGLVRGQSLCSSSTGWVCP